MSYVNISKIKIKPIRIADSTMLLMKILLSFFPIVYPFLFT
ncbi:hypothetical protein VIBHAR_06644 [Vibrio campbellii ATCC BAA-1116]|uniref:Uncharacterized protein n=1 Tax=Vibrio campbellii (strain ATCC BAA-1116) TaxID=2902295 RepID=A7N4D1_VIBC1|nr:hypothetical protein VIBHAR_06644 [Vibrio campbellii ATCC BAA-1116]